MTYSVRKGVGDPNDYSIQNLEKLAEKADKSSSITEKKISNWEGREIETLPNWAANHIENHIKFVQAFNQLRSMGCESKIPPDVIKQLEHSKEALRAIAAKVNNPALLKEIFSQTQPKTIDPYGLLIGAPGTKISPSDAEWHLNLGLLMDVYSRTDNEELKQQIGFLALNYLAKSAPINIKDLRLHDTQDAESIQNMFQLGFFQKVMTYSREAEVFEEYVRGSLREAYVPESGKTFYLTDTNHFAKLLPLMFVVGSNDETVEDSAKNWATGMADHMNDLISKNNGELELTEHLLPPFLFDLTSFLVQDIKKSEDPQKNEAFAKKLSSIEEKLNAAVSKAAKEVLAKNPKLKIDQNTLETYLRANMTSICRTKLMGMGVLKILPVFANDKFYNAQGILKTTVNEDRVGPVLREQKNYRANLWMTAFLNATGIRLGAVRGRTNIFNILSLPEFMQKIKVCGPEAAPQKMVAYSVQGPDAKYFDGKSDFLQTNLMTSFASKFANYDNDVKSNPQQQILGKATVDIIKGLFKEISDDSWTNLNQDPDTQMILQTSLTRLMQHLATANHHSDDFTLFSQAIELAHCEIATLLSLTMPFKEGKFVEIYKGKLDHIPKELRGFVQVGVGKSAMNIFCGVNAALMRNNKIPERTFSNDLYFEEAELIGETRADPKERKIDMLVTEFNHNIDLNPKHTTYKATDVIGQIEKLLSEKKTKGKPLTITIDETIDFVKSPKVKALLERFKNEIKSGQLNFVFFRSGQKFDMLGMDNYYGAPFYIVNNGDKQWKKINALAESPEHKTDQLSMQWFCLANKYAFKTMENYREAVFDNTKKILENVPEGLKPGNNSKIRVNLVAQGKDAMDPAFIDIKLSGSNDEGDINTRQMDIARRLFHAFAEKGKKVHARGSFGFYHPNFNVISDPKDGAPRNIRINPGLDPAEVSIIVDFLKELEKVYA